MYCLGGAPLGSWAMERRRSMRIAGANIRVAPIEYVILRKLEYYRMASSDRHLRDIAAMRRITGATIDRAALARWIEQLGLEPEWWMTGQEPNA